MDKVKVEAQHEEVWDAGPGLLESVWRYRWRVLAAVIALAGMAGGVSLLQPVRYEAQARLILADPRNAGVFSEVGPTFSDPNRHVRNQAERISSTVVLDLARERIDDRLALDEVRAAVEAEAATESDVITIRARDGTPHAAAELANAVAEAYQEHVAKEVRANAAAALAQLQETGEQAAFQERAAQLAVDAELYGSGVELFEPAAAPESPVQPRPVRNAATAALLAFVAAAGVAWWRGDAAQKADSRHDPARVLGAPLLGEIPDFHAVGVDGLTPTVSAPHSAAAEAYAFVLASLESALEDDGARSFLVTSAVPGDGKTTTAVNLAVVAARDGRHLLLVDADERMRGLSRAAGMTDELGLTDLIDFAIPSNWCVNRWQVSERTGLSVVPAGKPVEGASSFFRTSGFRTAVQRIKERADLVVFDSPPLLAVADTSAIAGQVDGIVMVVSRGTPMALLAEARERLGFIGAPLLGYVFNRAQPSRGAYGPYQYGQEPNGKETNGHAIKGRHRRRRRAQQKVDYPREARRGG